MAVMKRTGKGIKPLARSLHHNINIECLLIVFINFLYAYKDYNSSSDKKACKKTKGFAAQDPK